MQIVSELLWNLKIVPSLLLGAQVYDLVFVLHLELAFHELGFMHVLSTLVWDTTVLWVQYLEVALGHLILTLECLFSERLHFAVSFVVERKFFELNCL